MDRNDPLVDVGQRLGLFAYMTVMSGGRPFWPALFGSSKAIEEFSGLSGEPGGSVRERNPLADTLPYQYQREERDHIAA